MATRSKRSEEIRPGDVIEFLGTYHRVTEIDPISDEDPFRDLLIGRAKAADGWGITLERGGRTSVA